MTEDNLRYFNNYNYNYHYNLTTAINNLIDDFNNHGILDHPIDQIIPREPIGIPVVDGYVFDGFDNDPIVVKGQLTNETNCYSGEEVVPVGEPVTIGRPVFSSWVLDLCYVIPGRQV